MNRKKIRISIVLIALLYLSVLVYTPPQDGPDAPILGSRTDLSLELHVTMRHYRYGVQIGYSYHAGVLTTAGLNWIGGQLGGSPSTDSAKWIALSNDPSAPSSAWTEIPGEITTGGMGRSVGVYDPTPGDGVWEIEFVFSPTETASCQLTGLYYTSSGAGLLASDLINLINYQADTDTVTITWEITQT